MALAPVRAPSVKRLGRALRSWKRTSVPLTPQTTDWIGAEELPIISSKDKSSWMKLTLTNIARQGGQPGLGWLQP